MTNPYIIGIHEPPPDSWLETYMTLDNRGAGVIVHTHALGADPSDLSGYDYSRWMNYGYVNIGRLNNGYGPDQGTIPLSISLHDAFATRCANWVEASSSCKIWIIANEPNASVEGKIPHDIYAACFRKCYAAIKAVQPDSMIMPAPVAMWNVETEDWLIYYQQILTLCYPFDAICWHTYTHGSDPALITDMTPMGPPYEDRIYNFRAYLDLWDFTPDTFRDLPIYITETDQGDVGGIRNPWQDTPGVHWAQDALKEINRWNELHDHLIKALVLYRWPKYDEWHIDGKQHVHEDIRKAVDLRITHTAEETPDMITIGIETFNGPFVPRDDPNPPYDQNVGELKVQTGWTPFWLWQGENPEDPSLLRRPEFFVSHGDDPDDEDDLCQAVQTTFSTTDCCVWKKYTTQPGTTLLATVKAMLDSEQGAQNGTQMGIDPLGGTDMFAPSVMWSEWLGQDPETDKKWQTLTLGDVVSQSTQVTIFLRAKTDYAKNSATHWDDFVLQSDSEGPLPPEPGDKSVIRTVTITYLDDQEISRSEAAAEISCGDVDPLACALAQQLAGILCPSA